MSHTSLATNHGSPSLRDIAPREGTETNFATTFAIFSLSLRNIAPREGTETLHYSLVNVRLSIKQYSSPRGDGNCECFLILCIF